jgi:EmrB/QacA subfamily drug resistance transporter
LIAARATQGVGGALMTPGSLAILEASFVREDRARAIGAWSAFAGIATSLGPLVGGYLVDAASWRWVFFLNLPLSVAVAVVTIRHVPESSDPSAPARLDLAGTAFAILALTCLTYALVEASASSHPAVILAIAVAGLASAASFVMVERRSAHPMLPLDIFHSRQFVAANFVTLVVYAALGGILFLLGVYLQTALGYSPIEAGFALFPVTVIMLLLSARSGALATRIGPRIPMTGGPLIIAAGLLLMTRIQPGAGYVATTLPAAIVFGLGLALTVAPLTSTVLAAAQSRHAGVASGINNAVARTAQLFAIAVLPVLAGITGDQYRDPKAFASGFKVAVIITASLAASGGVLALLTIRNDVLEPSSATASVGESSRPRRATRGAYSCGVHGPPAAAGVRTSETV